MIIFYNKKTGKVVGTIEGRIHPKAHLKMWVSDKKENDRIVVNWKPFRGGFVPDHRQGKLFAQLDKKPSDVYKYKIDLKTKALVSLQT